MYKGDTNETSEGIICESRVVSLISHLIWSPMGRSKGFPICKRLKLLRNYDPSGVQHVKEVESILWTVIYLMLRDDHHHQPRAEPDWTVIDGNRIIASLLLCLHPAPSVFLTVNLHLIVNTPSSTVGIRETESEVLTMKGKRLRKYRMHGVKGCEWGSILWFQGICIRIRQVPTKSWGWWWI